MQKILFNGKQACYKNTQLKIVIGDRYLEKIKTCTHSRNEPTGHSLYTPAHVHNCKHSLRATIFAEKLDAKL